MILSFSLAYIWYLRLNLATRPKFAGEGAGSQLGKKRYKINKKRGKKKGYVADLERYWCLLHSKLK